MDIPTSIRREVMKRASISGKRFVLALFLLLAFLSGCSGTGVPDSRLRRAFFRNRDDFNKLLLMSEDDRQVIRIDFDSTIMKTSTGLQRNMGLSEARWREYRMLFRKLGITGGIERPQAFPNAVLFYARCAGSAIDADCKGFAYLEKPIFPVANSLDKPRLGDIFEPLSPNWYLFRWVT